MIGFPLIWIVAEHVIVSRLTYDSLCAGDLFTGHVSMWTIFTGPMLPEDDKLIIIYIAGITCY
jgi:hypothetical protein